MNPAPQAGLDKGSNRRLPWLGALLIAVCLGAVIWLAHDADAPEPAAQAGASAVQPDGRPASGEAAGEAGVPARVGDAASATRLVVTQAPQRKDQVEVCGLGLMKADASGQPENLSALQLPVRQAREQLLQALAGSGDEVSRAAGLLIQSSITAMSPETPAACAGAACASAEAASDAVSRVGLTTRASEPPPASAVAREALATLALTTRSAQVYAFALDACQLNHKEGGCQMLSAEQWARLDEGNAAPWLMLANEASDRGDAAAVSDALYHVAQSRTVDSRVPSVLGVSQSKLPAEMPLLVRVGLLNELQGIAIGSMPDYRALSHHCDTAELRDANRQQACAALADTLVSHGNALFDVMAGVAIGQRVGWPAERIQALRDEHDAIYESVLGALPTPARLWSCDAQQRLSRYLSEVGSYGEMGALRRSLRQLPESVPMLAQRHRDRVAKEVQAASAEASAASRP